MSQNFNAVHAGASDDIISEEEFNNFMYQVTEVKEIVQKLSSKDESLQAIGIREADRLLNDKKSKEIEHMKVEDIQIKVKSNKTIINKKALVDTPNQEQATMSQEVFMKEVSRDAAKRYKDKCVRTEKMETFKKRATKAFRRGEYEKALSCYNKAIEQIRDSPLLYNNRCMTYINLKLYKQAIQDANTALKLNESCVRSLLLLAKAHLLNGDEKEYAKAIKEAKTVSPVDLNFINDFHVKLRMSVAEDGAETSDSLPRSENDSEERKTIETIQADAAVEDALSPEDSTDSEIGRNEKKIKKGKHGWKTTKVQKKISHNHLK